jgi:hypothetical protein
MSVSATGTDRSFPAHFRAPISERLSLATLERMAEPRSVDLPGQAPVSNDEGVHDREVDVVLARCPEYRNPEGRAKASAMIALANLTRRGFADGDRRDPAPRALADPPVLVQGSADRVLRRR